MTESDSIKNFSYVGIARMTTIGIGAIFYLVIAALLEPERYGELNIIIALAGTFSIISLFGLNLSTQVYNAKEKFEISRQITTLFVVFTTVAALILVVFDPLAALLCVAMSFFAMNQSSLLGLTQYKKFMIFSILKSVSFFIIPLLLYFVFGIYGIIFGMAIGNFIGSIPFFKNLSFRSFTGLKNNFKVLVNNFGVHAGGTLPFMLDKLLIAPLFGFFIVGIYAFNLQVFFALSVLPGILFQYLVSEESTGVRHRKLSLIVVLASVILTIIVIILAPVLVPIFYPLYAEGIESLQILAITIIPMSIGVIFSSRLLGQESTRIGLTAIVRIGIMLILIVVLGEIYGLVGLSVAVLVSQCANTLFLYLLYQKNKEKTSTIN